jgi:hypothetical protein
MNFPHTLHELHALQVQRWETTKNLSLGEGSVDFFRPRWGNLEKICFRQESVQDDYLRLFLQKRKH